MSKSIIACVSSGHPVVTETARSILMAGGNAFDAIVAAGFVSSIAEPVLTSLGGGGFILAHTKYGQLRLFDFFVNNPGKNLLGKRNQLNFFPIEIEFLGSKQVFNIGLGSVAVPGTLKGYMHVHRVLGRLPLKDILAPAIQLAKKGIVVNQHQAYFLQLMSCIMTLSSDGQVIFAPKGIYLREGDIFHNQNLYLFLETLLTDGEREFYEGEIATCINKDMHQNGGLLTTADLSTYQVIEREPLVFDYHQYRIITNPLPSLGGTLFTYALKKLSNRNLYNFGSYPHIAILVAAMRKTEQYHLSQTNYANYHTTLGSTTHISIHDAEGNIASMTTSNGEGSGFFAANTGIMLNNMLGEPDLQPNGFHCATPGTRLSSMMAPSLLINNNNNYSIALGSGGSSRIRSAMMQVIVNVVAMNLDLIAAVTAPRIHWDGSIIQIEPGFESDLVQTLAKKWRIHCWSNQDMYFGGVHATSNTGCCIGDHRRGGYALALS